MQDRKRSQGGGMLGALSRLHLSPVIWGIILGMLGMMAYSVMQNSQFPPPTQVGRSSGLLGTWDRGLWLAGEPERQGFRKRSQGWVAAGPSRDLAKPARCCR